MRKESGILFLSGATALALGGASWIAIERARDVEAFHAKITNCVSDAERDQANGIYNFPCEGAVREAALRRFIKTHENSGAEIGIALKPTRGE